MFSTDDLKAALDWAKSAVNIEPTDIGKDVYDILFIEKAGSPNDGLVFNCCKTISA